MKAIDLLLTQFSKKLSTVIPEVTDGNKEIPWWESALGRQGGGAGWTNHPYTEMGGS